MRTIHFLDRIFLSILTFTCIITASAQDTTTLFQPTDAPTGPLFTETQGITLGMKFRSSQSGYIIGLRYYKGEGATGTYTGNLWSSTGVKLAQAVFTSGPASGWQQVYFNDAVPVVANTTYVASYHTSSGQYTATNPYFTQAVVNGSLRGLASGEDGPNGVFVYSAAPAFPVNNFQTLNYWVDVLFTTVVAPDINPPSVQVVSPFNAGSAININTAVKATFSEFIDPATVTASSFQLKAGSIVATGALSTLYNQVTLVPSSPLLHSTTYTVTIKGGNSGVKDLSGNPLANDYSWSFTTAGPPPTEGPGGPILVVSSASNPFSRYAAEILRSEGLNAFAAKDISEITASDLNSYDVIVLGEMPVTAAHVTMFTNWVNAGGTLIAFRPAVELSSLMGITRQPGSLSDKYLLVNTSLPAGTGIVGETIQFHGAADLYTLSGAASLATLYADASTATLYPAVTIKNAGAGKAVAFTYDLARSIVYTRQGNPAWAGQKRDGTAGPIRSDDLFFGTNSSHWIDFDKIDIPQADEQQRLLANIILQSNLNRKPLPRFWYLPSGHKAAIVMTGDDHGHGGTTGQFNYFKTLGPNSPQDVLDWKAVRATSYIYSGTLSNAQAAALQNDGFEIALHLSTGCTDFTPSSLQGNINFQMPEFESLYPSIARPVTNRTHCIPWSDWATAAKVQSQNGIRLDANYYYWPDSWVLGRPGMFTGSGMPMRFADVDGSMIDCYQVPTQMTDESGIDYASFTHSLLNRALGAEGYYGVFCANMHTDSASHSGANAIVASALAHGVPVISAKQLLTWLDGRNGSTFDDLVWNNGELSFSITALNDARNLQAMLPLNSATGQLLSITRNGSPLAFTTQTIKGMQYAFFPVAAGTASYVARYNNAPFITLHPVSDTVCEGQVTLKSTATGSPAPAVQWQVKSGNSWSNITGATNPDYTFNAVLADNNKQYRAVWTNSLGTTTSNVAVLTVGKKAVLSSALTANVLSGSPFSYTPTTTTAGTTITWSRAAVSGISNPAATGTAHISETLYNETNNAINVTYVYTLTGTCTNTQELVVTVYPSPVCANTSSITANFNSNSIKSSRYIWFNSAFDPSSLPGRTAFYVTNSKITFTANNVTYTLNVPDSRIRFEPNVTTASTDFVNNKWETVVPLNYSGNAFLTGLAWDVPVNLPGGIKNVKWTATISSDRAGVTTKWKWAAAVYSQFSGNAGIDVKPVDGQIAQLDEAGTPLNYRVYVIPGATGGGLLTINFFGGILNIDLLNFSGNYSSTATLNCNSMITRGPAETEEVITPWKEEIKVFEVRAMPNPSNNYFTLAISGGDESPVTIRIVDMSGRVMDQYQKLAPNTLLRIGEKWKNGMYIAEVIQGNQRKTVKLVKVN